MATSKKDHESIQRWRKELGKMFKEHARLYDIASWNIIREVARSDMRHLDCDFVHGFAVARGFAKMGDDCRWGSDIYRNWDRAKDIFTHIYRAREDRRFVPEIDPLQRRHLIYVTNKIGKSYLNCIRDYQRPPSLNHVEVVTSPDQCDYDLDYTPQEERRGRVNLKLLRGSISHGLFDHRDSFEPGLFPLGVTRREESGFHGRELLHLVVATKSRKDPKISRAVGTRIQLHNETTGVVTHRLVTAKDMRQLRNNLFKFAAITSAKEVYADILNVTGSDKITTGACMQAVNESVWQWLCGTDTTYRYAG